MNLLAKDFTRENRGLDSESRLLALAQPWGKSPKQTEAKVNSRSQESSRQRLDVFQLH